MKRIRRSKKTRYIFKSRWKRAAMGFVDAVGHALCGMRRKKAWDTAAVRRILLIRMDQIGDALFAASAVRYLHDLYPNATIDFLAGPWAAPLVKMFPHVSNTIAFEHNWYSPHRRPLECLRNAMGVVRILRSNRYDLGIDLRGDLRNILLMRLAGIPRTVGYGITGGKFLLHRSTRYDFSLHQVDLNMRLIEEVAHGIKHRGSGPQGKDYRKPEFFCAEALRESVLGRGLVPTRRPRILVHMEAGYPSKRWDARRYAELIAVLCARGLHVTLVGLERDGFCAEPLLQEHAACIADIRGKTNILELFAVIAEADLLIGNDSAPAHMAAGLGCPCVILFSGANDPSQWRPLGDDVHLLFHPVPCSPCESRVCRMPVHECMDAIRVHDVEGVVMDVLTAKGLLP